MKGVVRMKKFMALACALVLAVAALTACGGNGVDPTEVPTDVTEATIAE